jgi:hypothetical protein
VLRFKAIKSARRLALETTEHCDNLNAKDRAVQGPQPSTAQATFHETEPRGAQALRSHEATPTRLAGPTAAQTVFQPQQYRLEGERVWAQAVKAHDPERRSTPMASYWADRVGYRLWRDAGRSAPLELLGDLPPFRHLARDVTSNLRTWLSSHPAVGDAFPPAVLGGAFRPSTWLRDLLGEWEKHLVNNGIAATDYFALAESVSVQDLYSDSVYFPGPPAISGPGFLDWLEAEQVVDLVKTFAATGVSDFAVALAVIHERSHFLQTGDPLLAEIAWAALWRDFIVTRNLECFQVNRVTGQWCNLEKPYVDRMALTPPQVASLFQDTADGVSRIFADGPSVYETLCGLTWRFDTTDLRYTGYLDAVATLFETRIREGA